MCFEHQDDFRYKVKETITCQNNIYFFVVASQLLLNFIDCLISLTVEFKSILTSDTFMKFIKIIATIV